MDAGFSPKRRKVPLGSKVNWMFVGPNNHSVNDMSLGLFNSGSKPMVSYFNHTFTAAGTYTYADAEPPGTLTAEINVPVDVPSTATVGVPFTVTWASQPWPLIYIFEVQVQLPGAPDFQPWVFSSGVSAQYVAPTPGKYRFRARLPREPGFETGYSPGAWVTVDPAKPGPTARSAGPSPDKR